MTVIYNSYRILEWSSVQLQKLTHGFDRTSSPQPIFCSEIVDAVRGVTEQRLADYHWLSYIFGCFSE